jgi:hypothetical protein
LRFSVKGALAVKDRAVHSYNIGKDVLAVHGSGITSALV